MTFTHSPRIVTDSLWFYVDAGNVKSYPGTGTTWRDLSGYGRDVTLNSTGIYYTASNGGILTFSSSYGTTAAGTFAIGQTGSITFEAVAKSDNMSSWQTVLGSGTIYTQIGFNGTNFYLGRNGGGGNLFINGGAGLTAGQWYHMVMTYDGNTATGYRNGAWSTSGSIGYNGSTNDHFHIASYNGAGAEPLSGSIAFLRVYNRALTAAEIYQNYSAVRTRFGI